MAFRTFTVLCNHHHCLIPEHFHHPTRKYSSSPGSPWHPRTCFLSLWVCLFKTFHINGIIQCGHVWLLSPSMMFSRSTYITVACVSTSLSELNNIPLYGLLHFVYLFIFKTKCFIYLKQPWLFPKRKQVTMNNQDTHQSVCKIKAFRHLSLKHSCFQGPPVHIILMLLFAFSPFSIILWCSVHWKPV